MTPEPASSRGRSWGVYVSVGLAILLVLAWMSGLVVNAVWLGLLAYTAIGVVRRCVAAFRRRLRVGWVRHPLARAHRAELARCLVNWACLLVVAIVLHLAIIPEQLAADYPVFRLILIACVAIAALLELVPTAPPRTESTIVASLVAVFLAVQLLMMFREPADGAVVLDTPMAEELLVFQGGESPLINHHYLARSQRHAVDLVVVANDRISVEGATGNEASACFGKPVLAPAAGRIVRASDGLPDMPPGEGDRSHLVGNHIVIDIGSGRFVLLAHLRAGSLRVKPGDEVACGQPLAECGNSGNTSEAHVHIQVQDGPEFSDQLTTFPIRFRHVVRGGVAAARPISVRRNDRLAPSTRCAR